MRHESITITLRYYVDLDAANISETVWQAASTTSAETETKGSSSGNTAVK